MSIFDENNHYYSPNTEIDDEKEANDLFEEDAHYFSPFDEEEDEKVLPFSHVVFDEDELAGIGETAEEAVEEPEEPVEEVEEEPVEEVEDEPVEEAKEATEETVEEALPEEEAVEEVLPEEEDEPYAPDASAYYIVGNFTGWAIVSDKYKLTAPEGDSGDRGVLLGVALRSDDELRIKLGRDGYDTWMSWYNSNDKNVVFRGGGNAVIRTDGLYNVYLNKNGFGFIMRAGDIEEPVEEVEEEPVEEAEEVFDEPFDEPVAEEYKDEPVEEAEEYIEDEPIEEPVEETENYFEDEAADEPFDEPVEEEPIDEPVAEEYKEEEPVEETEEYIEDEPVEEVEDEPETVVDEALEDVGEPEAKFEFVPKVDDYDYDNTDDADDMADEDNVFDKENEYLFKDGYPEEPENIGRISDETAQVILAHDDDEFDKQMSFYDITEHSDKGFYLKKESFFDTHAPREEEAVEEPEALGAVDEPSGEIAVKPVIDEPVEEAAEPVEEAVEAAEPVIEKPEAVVEEPEEPEKVEEPIIENEREVETIQNAAHTPREEPEKDSATKKTEEKRRSKYMFSEDFNLNVAKITVVGVGGAGNNAVNRMIDMGVSTADFVAINTDKQALMLSRCDLKNRFQIGIEETKGLGAGADPEIGERAAEESREILEEIVDGVDLLFIAAGMGGGTGTGAAPVIAKIAKEKGCVTVAVVTKPFLFEGRKRAINAEKGVANLKKYVDTIIIIPNDKLMEALRPDTPMIEALRFADDTLRQGICGIADLIATPSLINLDFADVRAVLKDQGLAHMGIGRSKGENRIMEAVKEAVSSPLLETTIEGARGIILNVTGGPDLTIRQVNDAARQVQAIIDPSANIIFGMNINDNLQEEVIITLIATGFDHVNDEEEDSDGRNEEMSASARAYQNLFSKKAQPQPVIQETPKPAAEPVKPIEREPVAAYEPKPVQKEEAPKKELPAFMRKLFKK